jgi:hypothetical protein
VSTVPNAANTACGAGYDSRAVPRIWGELIEFRPGQWVRASLVAFVRAGRPNVPAAGDAATAPTTTPTPGTPGGTAAAAGPECDDLPAVLLVRAGGRDGLMFVGTAFSVRAINDALADLWLLGLPRR